MVVRVPVSAYIYICVCVCVCVCIILTNTQSNCAVTRPLFNYSFKSYLCSTGRARNANDADISVTVRNSFFFNRHSDLEGSCSNGT